jgi:hypothetical protein
MADKFAGKSTLCSEYLLIESHISKYSLSNYQLFQKNNVKYQSESFFAITTTYRLNVI